MNAIEIRDKVFWVGVVDWNMRNFHGHTFSTKRGSTYNSYLVVGEKIALVDAVFGPFAGEMLENIREVLPLERIDYVVANHVETDHSGALPDLLKLIPRAKVLGTAKCKEGLRRHYYGDWDFQTVATGDALDLGGKTLQFIEAPMIHWPDSMFTYIPQEKLLLPNDAFGQHYATSGRFDDEVDQAVLMEEAAKYYANILWPLSPIILKKIEEVLKMGLPIEMIAPSHGVIWRQDPARIVTAYQNWAKNTTRKKAVLVYETMWGSTEKMARRIADGMIAGGAAVELYDINQAGITEVVSTMLDAKGFVFGSSTHDNSMLTGMAAFMHFLKGLKPKNRIAAAFGSYGWAGGAVNEIEQEIKSSGIEIALPSLSAQFVPDPGELKRCYEFGREFAKRLS